MTCSAVYSHTFTQSEREREAHMLVCTVCEDVHEKKYPAANE